MLPPVKREFKEARRQESLCTDFPSLSLSSSSQLSRLKGSISQGTVSFRPQISAEQLLQPFQQLTSPRSGNPAEAKVRSLPSKLSVERSQPAWSRSAVRLSWLHGAFPSSGVRGTEASSQGSQIPSHGAAPSPAVRG